MNAKKNFTIISFIFMVLFVFQNGCKQARSDNVTVYKTNKPVLRWKPVKCDSYEIFIDHSKAGTADGSINSFVPFPLSFGKHSYSIFAINSDVRSEIAYGHFAIDDMPASEVPEDAFLLRHGWEVKSSMLVSDDGGEISRFAFDTNGWYGTSVPATALTVLVRNGLYADPYVGVNNMRIPDCSDEFNAKHDLLKHSHIENKNPWKGPYWYRKEFAVPLRFDGKRVRLTFNEINYKADVWVNGTQVGESSSMIGMERRFEFDITELLNADGGNCLAVAIYPLDNPGEPAIPPLTTLAHPGRNMGADGKTALDYTKWDSIGWDWQPGVRDRDMGITEDVYLSVAGDVEIKDVYVASDLPLPETNVADLYIEATAVNNSEVKRNCTIAGSISDGAGGDAIRFSKNVVLEPKASEAVSFSIADSPMLRVENPRLWWPVGFGEQGLYELTLGIESDGSGDEKKTTFGIREVGTYIGNSERVYTVNGKKIYCKGGNWVIDMMLNWTASDYDHQVRLARASNMNMLRVWGPTGVPPKAFFDAADKYGILVWQDFLNDYWGTDKNDPSLRLDEKLFETATIDIIKRLRNHPSIIFWCGGNEGFNPHGELIINSILPKYDGKSSRPYLKGSLGDGVHGSGPYHTIRPKEYFENKNMFGWHSEIGPSGVPVEESLYRFLPELGKEFKEDVFPLNGGWAYHDATDRGKWDPRNFTSYHSIVCDDYGKPATLDAAGVTDYAKKCQVVNYDVYRACIEVMNKKLWNGSKTESSGFAIWKFNASWPGVTWQIFDWYYAANGGFYGFMKANEPVHVQLNRGDMTVSVINTTLEALGDVQIEAELYDIGVNELWSTEHSASIGQNTTLQTEWKVPENDEVNFLKLKLLDSSGKLLSDNFYWLNSTNDFTKLNDLENVKLTSVVEQTETEDTKLFNVKLTNDTERIAFFVNLKVIDQKSGSEIVPTYWDKNYISILPGESVWVKAEVDLQDSSGKAVVEVNGFNVASEVLVY